MPRIRIALPPTPREYFDDITVKLSEIPATRGELAREIGMSDVQLGRLFKSGKGMVYNTLVRIENGLMTLRRRKAQEKALAERKAAEAAKQATAV